MYVINNLCARVLLKLNPFTTGIIIVLIQQKSVIIFSEHNILMIRTKISTYKNSTYKNSTYKNNQCSHINDKNQ